MIAPARSRTLGVSQPAAAGKAIAHSYIKAKLLSGELEEAKAHAGGPAAWPASAAMHLARACSKQVLASLAYWKKQRKKPTRMFSSWLGGGASNEMRYLYA